MDLTYTQKIKEQICNNNFSDDELKALLSAFFKNNIAIHISHNEIYWEIKSKTISTVEFIKQSIETIYSKLNNNLATMSISNSANKGTYKLDFKGDFSYIEKDLCIFSNPKELLKTSSQKNAYLSGAFLSGGSINNPDSSNYHFEIRTYNDDLANDIFKILKSFKINVVNTKRNKLNVVYVKKSEMIADILKYMSTTDALFEFEEKRIFRDFNNQVQRLNNLDMSNLRKSAESGNYQVNMIKRIKNSNLYLELSEKEKIYCQIRLENPSASLSEIMTIFKEQYDIEISRTGLNHYVRKIKRLDKIIDENI